MDIYYEDAIDWLIVLSGLNYKSLTKLEIPLPIYYNFVVSCES